MFSVSQSTSLHHRSAPAAALTSRLSPVFQIPNDSRSKQSRVTDWVVENLEDSDKKITQMDSQKAGENDTLPPDLQIAGFHIQAAAATSNEDSQDNPSCSAEKNTIRLLLGRNGWGTGVHPTTRLCLEVIQDYIKEGDKVIDYGCGSGILSIASLHRGASQCIGVDVEAEALVTAERNMELNGYYYSNEFEAFHTREIIPYGIQPAADLVVANILIGQLVRPSMVAALLSNLRTNGLLCLSGIRPSEVKALQTAYEPDIEWIEERFLKASDTVGSIESYGFDCGEWAAVVGRKITLDDSDAVRRMSESAVS